MITVTIFPEACSVGAKSRTITFYDGNSNSVDIYTTALPPRLAKLILRAIKKFNAEQTKEQEEKTKEQEEKTPALSDSLGVGISDGLMASVIGLKGV